MNRRNRAFIAIMLVITIGNYTRLQGNENIRTVQFLSILMIGVFAGMLIASLVKPKENKSQNQQEN